MLEAIQQVIEQHITPVLNEHGGGIELVQFSEGTLQIRLLGQCLNCPASQSTINDFVLTTLKEHFPTIKQIEVLESPETIELIDIARKYLQGNSAEKK